MASTSVLTTIENKISDVSSSVKKTDYDKKNSAIEKKVSDHNHDKYITTPEFNNLAVVFSTARLAEADLVTNADFGTKLQNFHKRVTSNKTKHLLVDDELKKLKTFDLGYFRGKNDFGYDGTHNYLVF